MGLTLSFPRIKSVDWHYFVALALIIPASVFAQQNQEIAQHWPKVFKPATALLLQGRSPYEIEWFFNPPWALIPMIPFVLVPDSIGEITLSITQLFLFYLVAIKMGAKPITGLVFVSMPYVLINAFQVNIDAFVAVGFILPPWIGLFFVLAKPQIGIGVAVYWAYTAWKEGGLVKIAKTFLPVLGAFLLSAVIYGSWMSNNGLAVRQVWNSSIWPMGLIFAAVLIVRALKTKSMGVSIIASPFASPYFALASMGVPFLGLLPGQLEMTVACLSAWVAYLITRPALF